MYTPANNRLASAGASLAMVLLIAYELVIGLRAGWSVKPSSDLVSVDIHVLPSPEPTRTPPPPPVKVHASTSAAKGAPAPRNLRNKATQIVAPKLPPLVVPPVVAATQAGIGSASNNGASDRIGPGQGAGGIGNGFGGGGNGGDGEGEGALEPPRQLRGHLSYQDMPEGLLPPGREARVEVFFWIEVDGSVTHCRTERSSGYRQLDALACRLIEQRFRFRPAMTEDHRPVRTPMVQSHTWVANDEQEDR